MGPAVPPVHTERWKSGALLSMPPPPPAAHCLQVEAKGGEGEAKGQEQGCGNREDQTGHVSAEKTWQLLRLARASCHLALGQRAEKKGQQKQTSWEKSEGEPMAIPGHFLGSGWDRQGLYVSQVIR